MRKATKIIATACCQTDAEALVLRVDAVIADPQETAPLFYDRNYSQRPRKCKALPVAEAELKLMARVCPDEFIQHAYRLTWHT